MILYFLFDNSLNPATKDLYGRILMYYGTIHSVFTQELIGFLDYKGALDLFTIDLTLKPPLYYIEEQSYRELLEDMLQYYQQEKLFKSENKGFSLV